MIDRTNANTAIHIANTDALLALVAALRETGSLDPQVFKRKILDIQEIQKNEDVLNQTYYDKTINNLIAAAEGKL